ncbi:MAG TPA: 4-hydroxythreonine-4-phosphate dehydrogenase PdxA [Beijerinckiaceae bacterium]|jgi:4-hydroxythreonine-4-phosphate dehydrogenase|nr:4-hydroxythreonine-4-phosphate dehydrogenase PdxA [Beijerinckiaceae bacterium]
MTRAPSSSKAPALALTQGDPSGIGPEIAVKAWLAGAPEDYPFFLLADPDHLARVTAALGLEAPIAIVEPTKAAAVFATALPVVPLTTRVIGKPGAPDAADAPATIEAIERAVALVRTGAAAGVVTNPIAKELLYAAGFRHPGHTEFLGELAERHWSVKVRPVMMLWSSTLAVVPATIHVALRVVFDALTADLIVETGRIVAHDLAEKFGVAQPRLAFAGLNPHAGEGGTMGREEIDIIAPAIAKLRAEGIAASGPHPADTMFHAAARAGYDAAICMYHDQALIPIKALAFDTAVNLTLGLPFIRTSPDHGTAFDIAGKGQANPASLIAALHLAADLTRRAGAADRAA